MKCPRCDKPMVGKSVEGELIIDVCDEHGIWLDHGELMQLLKMDRKGRRRKKRKVKDRARALGKSILGHYCKSPPPNTPGKVFKLK